MDHKGIGDAFNDLAGVRSSKQVNQVIRVRQPRELGYAYA